ncbi:cytochrome C oxidase subunit IV family protein [Ruegeria sp. HKCCD6157]|uniref:cytochrome C oxidase subunit IV family protein n=1 Tax=Ruegeria sp. HKCCD6157 TaxID=2690707 RepID=UPI001491537D|nr:cytochrome C oxidase subunit IV family protein [Ruegeria sp. HKCCD6157]NOE24639.1 nitric oxide reductase F protein [Ruegeria sp. HKCCD6157]
MAQPSSLTNSSHQRSPNSLTQAWLGLLALSVGSALLTLIGAPSAIIAGGILLLALIKASVILKHYLDLENSQSWLRGFTMVLTGFSVVVFALYLV